MPHQNVGTQDWFLSLTSPTLRRPPGLGAPPHLLVQDEMVIVDHESRRAVAIVPAVA
jgi:hypothetical protein